MKITQYLVARSSAVPPQPSLSPTVVDILQVLEDRQELVHEQWRELLTDLQAESSQYSEKAVVLDAEMSRYRRFLAILRGQVQERRIASSIICSGPIFL